MCSSCWTPAPRPISLIIMLTTAGPRETHCFTPRKSRACLKLCRPLRARPGCSPAPKAARANRPWAICRRAPSCAGSRPAYTRRPPPCRTVSWARPPLLTLPPPQLGTCLRGRPAHCATTGGTRSRLALRRARPGILVIRLTSRAGGWMVGWNPSIAIV